MENDSDKKIHIYLSQFFNENTQIVAKMCPKCYLENLEVKIIGVNLKFLKLSVKIKSENENEFKGFDDMEVNQSLNEYKKITKITNTLRYNIYKNVNQRILKSNIKIEYKKKTKYTVSNYFEGKVKTEYKNKTETSGNYFEAKIKKEHKERKTRHDTKDSKQNCDKRETSDTKYTFLRAKKEENIPIWIPPRSPHNLIEEELYHDPWAILIATIFLNKTSCKSARPYVFEFLKQYPDPFSVLSKKPQDLEKYFVNLGLQKTRAIQIYRMSEDFLYKNWKNVKELYGVGRYAEEAFRIFCLGDFSVEPNDRFLRIYKAWYEMEEKKSRIKEMNSC